VSEQIKKRAPGRPSKQEELDRRNQILDRAVELFANHGFERVLIKDIAKACGVATSLIHHHFGKKDDLRGACRDYVIGEIRSTLNQLETTFPDDQPGDPFDQIGNVLREGLGEQTHLIRFLALTFIEGHPASKALFKEYFELFHRITKRYVAAGTIRDDLDPIWITTHTIYNQLGTAFLYEQLQGVLDEDPYDAEVSRQRTTAFTSIARNGMIKTS